ncbi:MAG: hypothetical protein IKX40_10510 [Thermoguttaceae bacterium]|nr:hypothetical protein [Thermoguttaceae bacterium]
MCYFITIIVPEQFLREKTVKPPRGLGLTPMENPSIQKRILKNEVQLALTSGGCSCDLYSAPNEYDAEEPSQLDYSKKYAKKGWSKAKIARATESRLQSVNSDSKDANSKQIPDIVTDYLKKIVRKYGCVKILVHWYSFAVDAEKFDVHEIALDINRFSDPDTEVLVDALYTLTEKRQ